MTMKLFKLIFDKKTFDDVVFSGETDFTKSKYNEWLSTTVLPTLKQIYEEQQLNPSNIYVLGDIINILDNTELYEKSICKSAD